MLAIFQTFNFLLLLKVAISVVIFYHNNFILEKNENDL